MRVLLFAVVVAPVVLLASRSTASSLPPLAASPAAPHARDRTTWDSVYTVEQAARVRLTMPPSAPGTYGRQLLSDLLAYMLSVNGYPAGRVELPVAATTPGRGKAKGAASSGSGADSPNAHSSPIAP